MKSRAEHSTADSSPEIFFRGDRRTNGYAGGGARSMGHPADPRLRPMPAHRPPPEDAPGGCPEHDAAEACDHLARRGHVEPLGQA